MSRARQTLLFLLPSSWASRKIPRSPRLALKAPVMQATSTMDIVGPGTVTSKGKKVKNSKELLSRRSRDEVKASLPTPLRHTPQPRPCYRGIAPRLREWLHVLYALLPSSCRRVIIWLCKCFSLFVSLSSLFTKILPRKKPHNVDGHTDSGNQVHKGVSSGLISGLYM